MRSLRSIGNRQSAIGISLLLLTGLAGLYFSDRALRRMEKVDDVVLRGQTGLPWIDEFLARRAKAKADRRRYEAELKKLLAVVAAGRTAEERIVANYAIAAFEAKHGRSAGAPSREAWLAITREGGTKPETVRAWEGLTILATKTPGDAAALPKWMDGYLAAASNLPNDTTKLAHLANLWQLALRHRVPEVELKALEAIHRHFPRDPDMLEAYEALVEKYRAANQTERLAVVEESARIARGTLIEQGSAGKRPKGKQSGR